MIKFDDFSVTIYAVFHDVRKANTDDHLHVSDIYEKNQISFQTENKE